ncbi:MAG: hypothetical protein K5866_01430 [Treponema sp.]|nr:hypothetical protein [Treponema sp.]
MINIMLVNFTYEILYVILYKIMWHRENPIYGRKIFFCNPSLFIENFIIDALRQDDFEVYVLHDFSYAKPLLMLYPDSMCYFDIDSDLSFSAWYNFLKSFSTDKLSSTYLGIISETAKKEDTEKFLMNLRLPGGFINISNKSDKLVKQFSEILDLNGAKGRRKYIRLDTTKMKDVRGYLSFGDKLFSIAIKDISVAGFACTYKKDLMSLFRKNMHLQNVCLNIGRKSIVSSCIIFNTFISPDGNATSILMFTNENSKAIINDIRGFIIDNYVSQVDEIISTLPLDHTNYDQPDLYSELKTDRNYAEDEVEAELIEEIAEIEDLAPMDNVESLDIKDMNMDFNFGDSNQDSDKGLGDIYVPSEDDK